MTRLEQIIRLRAAREGITVYQSWIRAWDDVQRAIEAEPENDAPLTIPDEPDTARVPNETMSEFVYGKEGP